METPVRPQGGETQDGKQQRPPLSAFYKLQLCHTAGLHPLVSLQYFLSVISTLVAVAWIGQQVHNLFLTYLIGTYATCRTQCRRYLFTEVAV